MVDTHMSVFPNSRSMYSSPLVLENYLRNIQNTVFPVSHSLSFWLSLLFFLFLFQSPLYLKIKLMYRNTLSHCYHQSLSSYFSASVSPSFLILDWIIITDLFVWPLIQYICSVNGHLTFSLPQTHSSSDEHTKIHLGKTTSMIHHTQKK